MTEYLGKRFPKKWSAEERFRASYEVSECGCWNWLGRKYGIGYGNIKVSGKHLRAHRYSWMLANKQQIPAGMCVCHHCDDPSCVNPHHLFLGTIAENNFDKLQKGRQARGETLSHPRARGERNGNSRLTKAQVEKIQRDSRPQRRIADDFGVSQTTIWNIKKGKVWK